MKRPTKKDFLIGDDQFAKHYDRVGQITAMNKYIDYLEQQVKSVGLSDVVGQSEQLKSDEEPVVKGAQYVADYVKKYGKDLTSL